MANIVDPDQMPRLQRLIWVYTVCKGLSVSILRFITVYVLVVMKMFSFTDQGFEDTENSNFISPQYRPHGHSPIITPHLALETQHASLKRKKHEKGEIQDGSPPLDRSPGGQVDMSQHRPLSMVVGSQTDGGMSISTSTGSLSRQVFPCKIS